MKRCLAVCLALVVMAWSARGAEGAWTAVVTPGNSLDFKFLQNDRPALHLTPVAWGPKWAWAGLSAKAALSGDPLGVQTQVTVNKATGQVVAVSFGAQPVGARAVKFTYALQSDKDVPLTMIAAALGAPKGAKGKAVLTFADGTTKTLTLPLGLGANPETSRIDLELEGGIKASAVIEPARPVGTDGDLRIQLAGDLLPGGAARTTSVTLEFPAAVTLLATEKDLARFSRQVAGPDWFAFKPTNDLGPGVIGMEDWLEKPAGKRGGVRMVGDRFQLEDGTPIVFWGTNLSYGNACAPKKEEAEFTAARFARFGVNGVRLHKFTYPKNHNGIADPNDSTRMLPDGMDRLDYFSAELKKRGVYFGWSHTFGFYVTPAHKGRVLAYDEIMANLKGGNTYGFINLAEDCQDLLIETCVNLLKHKNPYTGQTYAEEPALSFVELQNEDDIFFFTNEKAFNACPTYKKHFVERFGDWLKAKYGTEEALKAAWGDALKPSESLAARNIVPVANPWFFSDGHLPQQKGGARQRLLDTAAHFHELQNKFYGKYVKAIRDAGYKGPICGSPWQAPSMLPHYYNLKSDYLAGYVDRHNYFGGKLEDSMLANPGSGYFSSGLQQVIDRPFGLSEWIHVYPSLYSAEGPAIVAAYGMGLQGWDASYQFQSRVGKTMYFDRAGWQPWGVWEADTPTQFGQYPALARMVLRGDVKQGDVISVRRVSDADLASGTFNFSDRVAQEGDVKSFTGSAPKEALAAGRVVVEFTKETQSSVLPDLGKYKQGSRIVSTTRQLAWETEGRGYFTIDTPGTKGVVGFAGGKPCALGDVTIAPVTEYASILLTASDKGADLASAKAALLTAVARSANTGFTLFAPDGRILENGKAPVLLEPVKASVALAGRAVAGVELLDHGGRPTGKALSVQGGRFEIDGARDQTMYYRVTFK